MCICKREFNGVLFYVSIIFIQCRFIFGLLLSLQKPLRKASTQIIQIDTTKR